MIIEIIKFFIYAILIVLISKYILVKALRRLAENLNLQPRLIGKISGVATSIPEFLTVTISSFQGLASTSIYNILSSNVINFIQYIFSIVINKNGNVLKKLGILFQNMLVILTILLPIGLLKIEEQMGIKIAVILIFLYVIFSWLIKKTHEKYLKKEEEKIEQHQEVEISEEKSSYKKSYVHVSYILLAGILLYLIGNQLGNVLNTLSEQLGIAESILGILLGFITSIPELITFFEAQKHYKEEEENKVLGVIETTNNLLTSNMLNLFIIQPLGIIIFMLFA